MIGRLKIFEKFPKLIRWLCIGFVGLIGLVCLGLLSVAMADVYVRNSTKEQIFHTEGARVAGGESENKKVLLQTENGISMEIPAGDAIVVLGCGVWNDGTPSPMLEARLEQGILLYQAGAADKILMSGDHAYEGYDEVNVMKQYAIDCGVPSEDIFMDHAGLSTYDSVWRAKNIFGCETVVFVSQEYHLYRAVYLAECLGMEAYGVSADFREYARQDYYDFREFFARGQAFVQGIIKPKAEYGGEAIPIWGNGNVTND